MVGAGTIVASALVNVVCSKLSSPLLKEFSSLWCVEKELEALENTIKVVKLVLGDAENRSRTEDHVYEWLRKLKEIVYDADNLLDELYLKAQRSSDTNRSIPKLNMWKRRKLAQKIKSINKQLDALASEKDKFHLNIDVAPDTNTHISNQETWSIFDEKEISGRNHEKKELISHLTEKHDPDIISIISIVGLGGLGKTTLAKLVFKNEYELKGCFNLRMWICVSQRFDRKRIVKEMIEQITKKKCDIESLESLGEKLLNELKDKKFLLVLDNVWDESIEEWKELKSVLINCQMGSKIIVTTRSERVSEMMKATHKIKLEGLSRDDSRELFNRSAFGGSERGSSSRYQEIAEELTNKCAGVPLALINLGNTMSSKDTIGAWEAVKEGDIWESGDDSKKVMQCLKSSYMHLPPYLKECFIFCSIFPKGEKINKLQLIGMWIAHGLIAFPDNSDAIEEMGNEYFKALVQKSFLQNVVIKDGEDTWEDGQETFMMNDLVHDLARSILGPEFLDMEGVTTNNCISGYEKVRAVYIPSINMVVVDMISKMKNLRSLVSRRPIFDTLAKCSNLIYLRYICFIECRIPVIPYEIGNLWNLQALHLENCYGFSTIPKSIGKLVYLRTLELIVYGIDTLPKSISQCRSLRNLIVSSKYLESIPNSLGQLAHIQLLDFSSCMTLEKLPDNILEKSNSIRSINLRKCENLEKVPDSFGTLKSLEILDLSRCHKLESLPESIGNLCNLSVLNLSYCYDLKKIPLSIGNLESLMNLDLSHCFRLESLPKSIGNVCNLRVLNLSYCSDLKEVPLSIGNLKSLKNLDLSHCVRLQSLPESIGDLCNLCVLNLKRLIIRTLPSSIDMLVNLVTLNLDETYELELPRRLGEMKTLKYLHMKGRKLDGMPIGIGNLINLRWLRTFAVGSKQRDDCASISELKDMKFLSGCLEINGLQNLHNPIEAEHANLKHKQHLDSLILEWTSHMIKDPHEYDWFGVLKALQPPSTIKSLLVDGYPGSEYPYWMMLDGLNTTTFPNLTSLTLRYFRWCYNLPDLVNLSHLRSLELRYIKNLTIVDSYFPSMVELKLSNMPKLEKVITMKFSKPLFPRLSKLIIDDCPSLIMQPHLPPSVVELTLLNISEEILARTKLPGGETSQISPISLGVREHTIKVMNLTKDCTSLGQLNSLRKLEFYDCELTCLPDSIRQLSSLLVLKIGSCKCLQELPDWLGELKYLQELYLENTPLSILPRSMKDLTQLQMLSIEGCPELSRRYNRQNREDWHLISHIPDVVVFSVNSIIKDNTRVFFSVS